MSCSRQTKRKKRDDSISWDDYFMTIAALTRTYSKDPKTRVGAVIVSENNQIVGTGYNSCPNKCDGIMEWESDDKQYYVVHAEANAILNKTCNSLKNAQLYCTLIPCAECAKLIIQSGITKVTYLSGIKANKIKYMKAKCLFRAAEVEFVQHPYKNKPPISVDFENIVNEEGCD